MLLPSRPQRSHAFTLVELLTVIAIIAVLMGILFPTISGAIESAKKVQAKNDELAIVTAIKAYYTEYGRYPTEATDDITLSDTEQATLMNELRVPPGYTVTMNPRKVTFLEVPDAKNITKPEAQQKQGISTTGKWLDPWGKPYVISIDANYTNSVKFGTTQSYTDLGVTLDAPDSGKGVNTGVIVSSLGKDGEPGKKGDKSFKGSDDVISWQ